MAVMIDQIQRNLCCVVREIKEDNKRQTEELKRQIQEIKSLYQRALEGICQHQSLRDASLFIEYTDAVPYLSKGEKRFLHDYVVLKEDAVDSRLLVNIGDWRKRDYRWDPYKSIGLGQISTRAQVIGRYILQTRMQQREGRFLYIPENVHLSPGKKRALERELRIILDEEGANRAPNTASHVGWGVGTGLGTLCLAVGGSAAITAATVVALPAIAIAGAAVGIVGGGAVMITGSVKVDDENHKLSDQALKIKLFREPVSPIDQDFVQVIRSKTAALRQLEQFQEQLRLIEALQGAGAPVLGAVGNPPAAAALGARDADVIPAV